MGLVKGFAQPEVANIIAAAAAALAALSAFFSYQATKEARSLAFQAQVAEQRLTALRTYSEAYGQYLADVDAINLRIPYRIDEPEVVGALSDAEMLEIARSSVSAFPAYRRYTTAVAANKLIWSDALYDEIETVGSYANRLHQCFGEIALLPTTLPNNFWQEKRAAVARECSQITATRQLFKDSSSSLAANMLLETRLAWQEDVPTK